jgi:MFS family permease
MGSFAIFSSTMSKNPVLNPFATSLGTPGDLLGIVAAASTFPGMLISLPASSLSDIIGRRKVLLFSAFIFASAPFLYLFVTAWWQLALVRFYHGFATAIFVPVTEATIAEHFPTKRGERISIFHSVTGIGRTIAPLFGGAILAVVSNGFQTLYLAVGTAGVTAFILAFLFPTEEKSAAPIQTFETRKITRKMLLGLREFAHNRGVLMVSLVQACQYYVFGAVEFFIVGYILSKAKLDSFYAGLILTAEIAILIATRPILGRLSDRKGREAPIILGSILGGVLLFIVPFTTEFPILLLLIVGYGLGFAAVISSTSPLMTELAPPTLVGSSMGFLSTIMDVGQTLGPIISGFILASVFQYTGLFTSLGILLVLAGVAFLVSGRLPRRKN